MYSQISIGAEDIPTRARGLRRCSDLRRMRAGASGGKAVPPPSAIAKGEADLKQGGHPTRSRGGFRRGLGLPKRFWSVHPRHAGKWLQVLRELTVENRMSQRGPSIFDLSPSEKLQLVEDLWDDLASTPEAVPVHDWQKQELSRRKANLLHSPASGLSWEEVKQRVRGRYGR